MNEKYEQLKSILRVMGKVVVAYSGGVDSTFLLKVALDTLGENQVLAVTAYSDTSSKEELHHAQTLAKEMKANHELVKVEQFSIPNYTDSENLKCFYRSELFDQLLPIMEEKGFRNVIYGVIAGDKSEYSLGMRKAHERGVRSPLQEVNLSKEDIRKLSEQIEVAI